MKNESMYYIKFGAYGAYFELYKRNHASIQISSKFIGNRGAHRFSMLVLRFAIVFVIVAVNINIIQAGVSIPVFLSAIRAGRYPSI